MIDTEEVGLRLKAFEYWKCSETGLTSDPATNGIKFVLAESLPGQGILNSKHTCTCRLQAWGELLLKVMH